VVGLVRNNQFVILLFNLYTGSDATPTQTRIEAQRNDKLNLDLPLFINEYWRNKPYKY
jgi:hypothetical protein